MIFYGENGSGKFPLPTAVSAEIERELGVPADSMTVRFEGNAIPELWRITAVRDGNEIFIGVADEQTTVLYSDRVQTTVYARSLAALALDCEAPPGEYIDPTVEVMHRVHLAPFGITLREIKPTSRRGRLSIPRGCSHYGAVRRFCRNFLGTQMRINSLGEFLPNALCDGDIIKIDKEQCMSASIRTKRYGVISDVYVTSGDKNVVVENEAAKARGIVRHKRIDLADSSSGTLSDADEAINDSMDGAKEVRVRCSGYVEDIIGRKAMFDGEVYRICKTHTLFTPQEQYTDIVMKGAF